MKSLPGSGNLMYCKDLNLDLLTYSENLEISRQRSSGIRGVGRISGFYEVVAALARLTPLMDPTNTARGVRTTGGVHNSVTYKLPSKTD